MTFPPIEPDNGPGIDGALEGALSRIRQLKRRRAAWAAAAAGAVALAVVLPITYAAGSDRPHHVQVVAGPSSTSQPPQSTSSTSVSSQSSTTTTTTTSPETSPTTIAKPRSVTTTTAAPQTPTSLPSQYSVTSIACVSSQSCFGTFVSSVSGGLMHWDGQSWRAISATPDTSATGASGSSGSLNGISCGSASSCMAVGAAGGKPVALTWDGTRWRATEVPVPPPLGGSGSSPWGYGLDTVSCSSPTECVAVGLESYPTVDTPNSYMFAVVWNGTLWTASNLAPGDGRQRLSDIACPAPKDCTAVGASLNGVEGFSPQPLAEHWDGTSWAAMSLPASSTPYAVLDGISCPTQGWCMAVGDGTSQQTGTATTSVGYILQGGSWGSAPYGPGAVLKAIACQSPAYCVAVGEQSQSNAAGIIGVYKSSWTSSTQFSARLSAVADPSPGYYLFGGESTTGSTQA